ncbi:enoyl-CoA hydratase domain-containing protein 3, mitochondrial isoform X2 [Mustela lutreola]|uniref:enoyl-CoA hydratase domain-containing protein 3, mitochondrial isoform X2 n=1 Tax=Mustela lutreola TaxID=9666 RepID=UPI002797907E|nr:enoyl-CoA hydratase domain-containing protein 3, mitochondrial isoform X2 [Mustela lutreola]
MAAAGFRAFGAKGPAWLGRSAWAQLSAGFCSRGPAGAARPELPPRPTRARQQDGIRNIVLSDPKKRNALSLAMLKSLQSDLLHEAESKDLRVIIISAEGPVFSSGHDLKELTDERSPDYHAEVFQTCSEVMLLIQKLPVPVIAMVNGLATAAGCQLVASCDIAVASDKSSFATPGVNIGLFCSTPGVALGRAVPRKKVLKRADSLSYITFAMVTFEEKDEPVLGILDLPWKESHYMRWLVVADHGEVHVLR